MARFRNRLSPIKSEKHESTWSFLAADQSSANTVLLIDAKKDPTASTEIEIGDHVKWIFVEVNFAAETITSPKVVHWWIAKRPFSTASGVPSVYDQVDKRFILKRGMEMLPKDVSTVFKRVFVVRIPKGMQRFGDTDELEFKFICTSAETINVCGFAIFRAYS